MSILSNDLLTLLARTPATVRTILEDLPEHLLHASVGEGGSSPIIALTRLIQGEVDNWILLEESGELPEIVESASQTGLVEVISHPSAFPDISPHTLHIPVERHL